MNKRTRYIKNFLLTSLWIAIGGCGIALLVAAVRSKDVKLCKGVVIDISGASNNFFIDKADVLEIITNYVGGKPAGRSILKFNLSAMEKNLERDVWVKNAELYFDNNEMLRVSIDEREPVARIFSTNGNSFYIDSSLKLLPLSEKFSARLPVFTSFANNGRKLSSADTVLLKGVKEISAAIQADEFVMAMIDQIDITPQRSFEMIPKIGNQVIVFGDANNIDQKLQKLRIFYQSVMLKAGWNKYSIINLEFENQVVAKIKDAAERTSDSLRALQIMNALAERSARLAEDSIKAMIPDTKIELTDSTMIQRSLQRDEPVQTTNNDLDEVPQRPVLVDTSHLSITTQRVNIVKPATENKLASVNAKPVIKTNKPAQQKKPAARKPVTIKPPAAKPEPRIPKAVMEGNN